MELAAQQIVDLVEVALVVDLAVFMVVLAVPVLSSLLTPHK